MYFLELELSQFWFFASFPMFLAVLTSLVPLAAVVYVKTLWNWQHFLLLALNQHLFRVNGSSLPAFWLKYFSLIRFFFFIQFGQGWFHSKARVENALSSCVSEMSLCLKHTVNAYGILKSWSWLLHCILESVIIHEGMNEIWFPFPATELHRGVLRNLSVFIILDMCWAHRHGSFCFFLWIFLLHLLFFSLLLLSMNMSLFLQSLLGRCRIFKIFLYLPLLSCVPGELFRHDT